MKRQKTNTLVLTALILFVGLGFLVLASRPDTSMMGRVQRDLAAEKSRFLPENSIDVSMAMGIVTFDKPRMLNPPQPGPPQLLFPPSEQDLERLSGPM